MSHFSGIIQLTNLDDFITPSQECIKPVQIEKEEKKSQTGSKIKIEDDGTYVNVSETGEKNPLGRVDISLADCLACSGCITTAETVLINQQSHQEVLRVFKNKKDLGIKLIVVSVAIQPILSLAEASKLKPMECFKKLSNLLKSLGADLVIDMTIAEDMALIEEEKEFEERYKNKTGLPMLASTCPGWVCYAEKTKSNLIPNLSTCRSPQQIMGRLVKNHLSKDLNIDAKSIYHLTLMPCYDKKLEASREEFIINETREVDCVITPVEIIELVNSNNLKFENESEIDWPWHIEPYEPLSRPEGSGSGGYAHRIANFICHKFGVEHFEFENVKKSSDLQVATIKSNQETIKVAIVTGFRNIQNVVNKMKRGNCDYDYMEVMACPSGCLNGGAQIKGQAKQLQFNYDLLNVRKISELYEFYNNWLGGFNNDSVKDNLHTSFKAVTYNPNPLNIKW